MPLPFVDLANFRTTGQPEEDIKRLVEVLSRYQQDVDERMAQVSIGANGATIGTVGTTAVYLREVKIRETTVHVVTSD